MYVTQGLSGLGATSAAKLQKKLDKIAAKETKHDTKIAAKIAKYAAAGKSTKVAKVQAKEAKHDAKLAKKVGKYSSALATVSAVVPQIIAPAPVTSSPKTPPGQYAGEPAVIPTVAPPAAADSTATLAPPSNYGYGGGSASNFGPPTDQPQFDPQTAQVAPADESSNMPLYVGLAALGAFLFMKKRRN